MRRNNLFITMHRMSKLLIPRLLLIFALLLTQLGGLTHGIAHTLAEQIQDQSLPHDHQCELCAAYAQVGSAVGSAGVNFDFASPPAAAHCTHFSAPHQTPCAAFAARAPPRSA